MTSTDYDGNKSLVKLANPILVKDKPGAEKRRCKAAKDITADRTDTQDILNCILPPREWEENGQTWREQISSEPATRTDVIRLGEQLDRKLQQQQARETGICAVRRELFNQAFDEVVRQVTVRCSERGLLLLRVRDELRMTLAALQSLYKSSVAFGMKKARMREQGKLKLAEKIEEIKIEKVRMSNELNTLETSYDLMDKNTSTAKADAERKHLQEKSALMNRNAELKAQLEAFIAQGKTAHLH